jgi:hypothetical protein
MKKYGGPANGTPLPEWTINDDGLGMLTGTLKVFIDGPMGGYGGSSGSGLYHTPVASGNAGSITGLNKYSGNNGLSNPKGPSSGGGLGAGIPKTGDPHPYDSRLTCFGVSVSRNSMGIGYAEAQYVGLLQEPAGLEWDLSCPTEDDPIETHPNFHKTSGFTDGESTSGPLVFDVNNEEFKDFKTVTKNGINPQTRGPYWDLGNVHIDGPTQSFKGFRASDWNIKNGLVGVESYKVPRATLRINYTTSRREMWKWAVDSLGKYTGTIPSPFVPKGYDNGASGVPNEAGSQNWLLVNVSVSEASGLYKVSIEFMASGRKGWNKIIYQEMEVAGIVSSLEAKGIIGQYSTAALGNRL